MNSPKITVASLSLLFLSTALTIAWPCGIAAAEEGLITVEDPKSQAGEKLLKQWKELPEPLRKQISSVAVLRLGLSSTGTIQLIGVYDQHDGNDKEAKPTRLFHLRQTDLFGQRLFWSILVNPEDATYKVLFHINEAPRSEEDDKETKWLKLETNSPD